MEKENIVLKKKISKLENLLKEQTSLTHKHKILADFDFLTKVSNRASFTRAVKDMLSDLVKRDYPFVIIYLDLDDFKQINDRFSHNDGDKVLIKVAETLILKNRAHTIIGRLGGEEFGIALPGVEEKEALCVANRLRAAIENIEYSNKDISVTASIGVYIPNKEDNMDDVIYKADKAMYISKNTGKNKITVYKGDLK